MSTKTKKGKGKSTGEEAISIVGVDLAGMKFDAYCNGKHGVFPNTALGRSRFKTYLSTLPGRVVVAFESTGSISRPFTRAMMNMGVEWRCLPPGAVRRYADSMGIHAKTDAKDARVIAKFTRERKPADTKAVTVKLLDLQELMALRRLYVRDRAHYMTSLAAYRLEETRAAIRRKIAELDKDIAAVEKKIDAIIAADKELAARRELYVREPGIGPCTARELVCHLPELGTEERRKLASLVGLAPYNRSSGDMDAPRHVRGGRKKVRTALYRAAIAVRRCRTGDVKEFYLRLKSRGKPNKLIAIACAHKMLLRLNAAVLGMKRAAAAT